MKYVSEEERRKFFLEIMNDMKLIHPKGCIFQELF